MKQEGENKLITTDGGVLRRKSDRVIFGESVSLGTVWFLQGAELDAPHKESIDDYEEVKTFNFEGQDVLIPTTYDYGNVVDFLIRTKYSISEEMAILRQRHKKEEEFEIYNDFCELCKRNAKMFLNIYVAEDEPQEPEEINQES